MFGTNPFEALSAIIPVSAMEIYLVVMVIMVIGGTVIDMIHKGSAQYFFENAEKAKKNAKRQVSGGDKVGLAVSTLANEVLTSGEFKNPQRRMSHLLTMYGFIFFVVSTVALIFGFTGDGAAAPSWLTFLWHIGAIMLAVGGYWFWFFIRVDVSAEGHSWYQFSRADIFIVSLLMMSTWAIVWSATMGDAMSGWNWVWFGAFLAATTTLFSTVLWSKFAHMFFKPAAAFQKKVTRADGSQENLPDLGDLTDPALQSRYPDIPEYMGKTPPDMGPGIKREAPGHF